MTVRALKVFDFMAEERQIHMDLGDVMTIENGNQAQDLITNGYAEEVVQCEHCGSYVKA
jgi:hypothetical protein